MAVAIGTYSRLLEMHCIYIAIASSLNLSMHAYIHACLYPCLSMQLPSYTDNAASVIMNVRT